MDTFTQMSWNSVPSSIQYPVTSPSLVIPPNGRHSEWMRRARTDGRTALPSFRVVGMSVVNFTSLCFLSRKGAWRDSIHASTDAYIRQAQGRGEQERPRT